MLQIVQNLMKGKTKIKILYKIKKLDKNFKNILRILRNLLLNFEVN